VAADIPRAVIDVLNADATLATLVPAKFWREEEKPDDLPHGLVFDEGGVEDVYSEGDALESAKLRVEVYASRDVTADPAVAAEPAAAVEKIFRRVKDVLRAGVLAVDGRSHYDLRSAADRGRVRAVEQRDPGGLRVYQGTLRVYAAVSRARV
jgi:hypothetical protein